MKLGPVVVLVVALVFTLSCGGPTPSPTPTPTPVPTVTPRYWAYQLQNADIDSVITSGFDLVVIDYSRDGTEDSEYAPGEIGRIRGVGVIPIAYLSIGEAESYRFYWQDDWESNPPSWLGKENPDWEGNYKVKYWDDEWKDIIYRYLDKIIEQGFSGAYLDIIDAFEYWGDGNSGEDEHLTEEGAARRMITFVKEIAYYCRVVKGKGDFYIFPQNGERILDYDSDGSYLVTISGISVEDTWYDGISPKAEDEVSEKLLYLDRVVSANKLVLSVDYVDDGSGYSGSNKNRIDDYLLKAKALDFVSYVARSDRELDRLSIIEGVQP